MVLLADSWPNFVDLTVTVTFLAVALLLPAAGYVFMILDIRAYLRSLNRALSIVAKWSLPGIPEWARRETPRAVAAFGLRFPCTEEQLKQAYRKRVKQLHPDHGGDQRRFMLLQSQFEEALVLVSAQQTAEAR